MHETGEFCAKVAAQLQIPLFVCYCLGITAVDPAKIDLLFERFISAERGELPDIDVDFEHERREEVIQYIYIKNMDASVPGLRPR